MINPLATWLYGRLGRFYPTVFIFLELQLGYLVTAGTIALLTFYIDTEPHEFWLMLAFAGGFTGLSLVVAMLKGYRLLGPVRSWIAGARSPAESVAAWRAAAELPVDFWRRHWHLPIWTVGIPASTAVVLVLDQPWITFFPLMLGSLISIAYAGVLQSFVVEQGMRPVLTDITRHLPAEFRIERAAIPLRVKLMAALPLLNIITALVVAGLTSDSKGGAASLGIDVLLATAVAFTISLELTVLLSRSILGPVRGLVSATEKLRAGDYDVQVPVTTSDELGQLATAFNQMVVGLKEREQIREAFGTYLDREVAEHILREGTALEGEEVEVSILFCDVRDFTGFAARAQAREVVAKLNALFETVVPIIAGNGGHVDKFVGDGLLAVFGAPQKHHDHADRAVAAALQMAAAVSGDGSQDLRIGIGINSGQVVAGSVGGAGRLDFSVIGDAVNVAARVEAATRETGDDILITAATRDLLSGTVELQPRRAMVLKGKDEPVELFSPRTAAPPVAAEQVTTAN